MFSNTQHFAVYKRCMPSCHLRWLNTPLIQIYTCRQKRPTKILSTSYVMHWCLYDETHPCVKVMSTVVMFCLRFGRHGSLELHQMNSVVITWHALIGTSRKLAVYNYTAYWQTLNKAWVWTGGYKQSLLRYAQVQSRTCYQECGCHLYSNLIRCGQNLRGPFLRATLPMSVGSWARAMANNGETKGLITPPSRWVSAQLVYVCVTAW